MWLAPVHAEARPSPAGWPGAALKHPALSRAPLAINPTDDGCHYKRRGRVPCPRLLRRPLPPLPLLHMRACRTVQCPTPCSRRHALPPTAEQPRPSHTPCSVQSPWLAGMPPPRTPCSVRSPWRSDPPQVRARGGAQIARRGWQGAAHDGRQGDALPCAAHAPGDSRPPPCLFGLRGHNTMCLRPGLYAPCAPQRLVP